MVKTFAIIFGLNYLNQKDLLLDGCINDSRLMEKFMNRYLNIPISDIKVYNDHSSLRPNKTNMLKIIQDGINTVNQSNYDRLWIHYSGHGHKIKDRNSDESDNIDEALVPLDRTNDSDCILDDDLNRLFSKINKNKTLVCIFDCCHSGSMLDLPYRYNYIDNTLSLDTEVRSNITNNIKCSTYLLSGCQDKEYSYDGISLSSKYSYTGAFSASFLKIVQNQFELTFDYLVQQTYDFLKNKEYKQTPQITTNQTIDNTKVFIESENWEQIIIKIKVYYTILRILVNDYKKSKNRKYISKILQCKNNIVDLLLV